MVKEIKEIQGSCRTRTVYPTNQSAAQAAAQGFVFTELLLILALLAGMAMAAAPSLGRWLIRDRVDTQARALLAMFSYARSETIKRGVRVTLCRYDGERCRIGEQICMQTRVAANDWACGYAALAQWPRSLTSGLRNNQKRQQHQQSQQTLRLLRVQLPVKNLIIRGNMTPFSFTPPDGRIGDGFRSFEISARSIEISADDQEMYRCVRVAMSGRARMVKGRCKTI